MDHQSVEGGSAAAADGRGGWRGVFGFVWVSGAGGGDDDEEGEEGGYGGNGGRNGGGSQKGVDVDVCADYVY